MLNNKKEIKRIRFNRRNKKKKEKTEGGSRNKHENKRVIPEVK